MGRSHDVVVVGGGPAGSTVARLLAGQGFGVLLLDEARFPRDKVCGEAVSPGAWRRLEAAGLAPALRNAGAHPLAGMRLVAPDGTAFEGRYGGGSAFGFALPRRVLDKILLDRARAAGVEVREGARVTGLERDADAVTGVRVGDHVLRARLVIGADGRRSLVARALGLLREARWPRRFAVRGHWEGVPGLTPFGEMHVGGGGYCGVAPLGGDRANVAFVLPQGAMMAAGGGLEAFYRAQLPAWPRLWPRLAGARLLEPPRALGPLALESRGAWAPGVLLVGDAAGFFDPFTGEGIAAALQGAELAAEIGEAALAGRASLHDYGRAHRALVRRKFLFNRAVQALITRETVANLAARMLQTLPAAADALVGVAGDLFPEGDRVSCRMASTDLRRATGRHRRS